MVDRNYVPSRGDIVWLSFTPHGGRKQAGHRPAVVLSPRAYNGKTSLALMCPIMSRVKGYPFEVTLPSASTISGVVLADQIKSLDWRAGSARYESRTTTHVVGEVLDKVGVLLE